LRQEIRSEDFNEVLHLFLDEADEVIARLGTAGDAASLESDLHCLKGSALNLGLTELARICQDGERSAAAGSIVVSVPEVARCYHLSREALLEGLVRLEAA
jgi:HPt (histidine-containing phosphotransfer) domain-containing protein